MAGEIFICYRRADQVWARLLHARLQEEGVAAWYDALVGPGNDWRTTTAKALEASEIFVLLFSANAAESSDMAKELAAATLENKLIIPIRLQNVAPKGAFLYELASRNWINAYEDTEVRLSELAKSLAQMVRTGTLDERMLPLDRVDRGAGIRKSRKGLIVAAAVAVLLAAAGLAAALLWPQPRWTVDSSRPFISTLALEDYPAFSRDGATLAYTSGPEAGRRQIYVRNLSAGDGIRVTHDDYDDVSPSWSSDGARLAYVAQKPGERCRIMVTTVPAGEAREAGRCEREDITSLTWQPGTPFVYLAERGGLTGSAIFRLNLDTGKRDVVVAKTALRDVISGLRCSPDGKWLAYLLLNQQIVLRDLASGAEKNLGTASGRGSFATALAWTGDSATLLAGVSGMVGGSTIVAHPLSGAASYNVYTSATRLGNFAIGGGLLALETDISRGNLARAGMAATQPDIIDPANGLSWSPSFAPDGTLAFLSNRSGSNAIWLMKPGAAPALLFDGGLSPIYRVRFSPDGGKLVVASQMAQGSTVRVLTRDGASQSVFETSSLGLGLPSWTPDGKALLIFDRRSLRTMRVAVDNPARRTPFAPPHWVGIAVRNDGTFATRADKPGIWRIDGAIRQINDVYPAFYDSPLAFRGADVLVPQYEAGGATRILAQPVAGGPSRLIASAPGAVNRSGLQTGFAVNPLTQDIIYVAQVSHDTNIDLLTMARR